MAFTQTGILSTREPLQDGRWLCQITTTPFSRIDKVSVYLDIQYSASDDVTGIDVTLGIYNVSAGEPSSLITTSTRPLSDLKVSGFLNFDIPCTVSDDIALVVHTTGATLEKTAAWRYVQVSTEIDGDALLVSTDAGTTWVSDTSRKFCYITYSLSRDGEGNPDTIDTVNQTVKIPSGERDTVEDNTEAEFSLATLERAVVSGDTVRIDFGEVNVTLVVDQSGSMTWNDYDKVRFTFLKAYIADLEASLGQVSKTAKYSIVKFRSRQIGDMRLTKDVVGTNQQLSGIKQVRINQSAYSNFSSYTEIFKGTGYAYTSEGITPLYEDQLFYYEIYTDDYSGNASEPRYTVAPASTNPKAPAGAAGFTAEEIVVETLCNYNYYDLGDRYISVGWNDPEISSDRPDLKYAKFYIIRRTDRFADSIIDVDNGKYMVASTNSGYDVLIPTDTMQPVLKQGTTTPWVASSYSYRDFYGPVETLNPVAGLTYYYTIFTAKDSNAPGATSDGPGIICFAQNARKSSVKISAADRFWDRMETPDPSLYCFSETGPLPPDQTVVIGNKELKIAWTAPTNAARYVLVFSKQPINTTTGVFDSPVTVYDGSSLQFVHRSLTNDQPHFYTLTAYDRVGNASTPVDFVAYPTTVDLDTIEPAPVNNFFSNSISSSAIGLTWDIPILQELGEKLWLDDVARLNLDVSFQDLDSRTTSAILEIVEVNRNVIPISDVPSAVTADVTFPAGETINITTNAGGATVTLSTTTTQSTQDLSPSILLSQTPSTESSLTGLVQITSSTIIRNSIQEADITVKGSLRVKNNSTGQVITQVITDDQTLRFYHPLSMQLSTRSKFSYRTWQLTCNESDSPRSEIVETSGTLARIGSPIKVAIELNYKDSPVDVPVNVKVWLLDPQTRKASPLVQLPKTGSDGSSLLIARPVEVPKTDWTGTQTGVETKNILFFDLPVSDTPGYVVVRAEVSYLGYSRTGELLLRYGNPLNIDVSAKAFIANGSNFAEQSALVYLGAPDWPIEQKIVLAQDATSRPIAEWSIKGLTPVKPKPLYGRDGVPGSGVKSYVNSGIAKNVFFGPSNDVQQNDKSCTAGECWAVTCKVEFDGLSRTEYGVVFIDKVSEDSASIYKLNKIFCRNSNPLQSFYSPELWADGIDYVQFEVLADPSADTRYPDAPETFIDSGQFFKEGIASLGGIVPSSLADGTSIFIEAGLTTQSSGAQVMSGQTVTPIIEAIAVNPTTNTQYTNIAPFKCLATIVDGRATFKIKCNTQVVGPVIEPPSSASTPNLLYDRIGWSPSPMILTVHVYADISTGGGTETVRFEGGGSNQRSSTPPLFVSLKEPLAIIAGAQ